MGTRAVSARSATEGPVSACCGNKAIRADDRWSARSVWPSGSSGASFVQDAAKKISKLIRDEAPKSVKSQIQGDELRVSSKSRDDLQSTMALLKNADLDVALQFVNFR